MLQQHATCRERGLKTGRKKINGLSLGEGGQFLILVGKKRGFLRETNGALREMGL